MAVFQKLVEKLGGKFPVRLREDILAALKAGNDGLASSLAEQMLVVAANIQPDWLGTMRLVDGQILARSKDSVVYGSAVYPCEGGYPSYMIVDDPVVIGRKPCWIERCFTHNRARVNWAGARDEERSGHSSIYELVEFNGQPCYRVEETEGCGEHRACHLVRMNGKDGPCYGYVPELVSAGDKIGYRVRFASNHWTAFINGEPVAQGTQVGRMVSHGGHIWYAVQSEEGGAKIARLYFDGTELASGTRIEGPTIVNGSLAFAVSNDDVTWVTVGDRKEAFKGTIERLDGISPDRNNSEKDGVAVWTIRLGEWEYESYANFAKLPNVGLIENNTIVVDKDGKLTLRLFRPLGEREPEVSFNLQELGAITVP